MGYQISSAIISANLYNYIVSQLDLEFSPYHLRVTLPHSYRVGLALSLEGEEETTGGLMEEKVVEIPLSRFVLGKVDAPAKPRFGICQFELGTCRSEFIISILSGRKADTTHPRFFPAHEPRVTN